MSTDYTITAKGSPDVFLDRVSVGDAVKYVFDFSPWQEDNNTITSVTWSIEKGMLTIEEQALSNGVASALVTFSQSGKSLVGIIADTGSEKKKAWLEVSAKDAHVNNEVDDYV